MQNRFLERLQFIDMGYKTYRGIWWDSIDNYKPLVLTPKGGFVPLIYKRTAESAGPKSVSEDYRPREPRSRGGAPPQRRAQPKRTYSCQDILNANLDDLADDVYETVRKRRPDLFK